MGSYETSVANRLKTARGHLDGVLRMVERQAYCPDVMKQLAAVQGLLETTSREVLRHHLETCVAKAMQEGRVEEIVDELMATLKYDKRVLAPLPDPGHTGSTPTAHPVSVPTAHPGSVPTAHPGSGPTAGAVHECCTPADGPSSPGQPSTTIEEQTP